MTQDLVDDAVTGDKIEDGTVELSVEQISGPPNKIELGGSGEATVSCDKVKQQLEVVSKVRLDFSPT